MKKKIGMVSDGLTFISGLIAEILAIICLNYGTWFPGVTKKEFGGDAYTEIHAAIARAANNVQDLTKFLKFGFAAILIVAGLILMITSAKRLAITIVDMADEKKAQQAQFVQSPEFQSRLQRAALTNANENEPPMKPDATAQE